jgi:VanZ family protein
MTGLLGLSSVPGSPEAQAAAPGGMLTWIPPTLQNLLHIPFYAGLAALASLALSRELPVSARAMGGFALAAAFGILDEAYQSLIPGRFPSATDWSLDALGALAGALFIGHRAARPPRPRR